MSTEDTVTGQDFLILSTQDWDALPTRKHRFARRFAQNGNRVLYVEQQMHWAGWLVDIRHQFSRAWRWLSGPRQVEPNVWVFTLPIVLPFFQMAAWINRVNNIALLPVLRAQLRRLGFENPVLWVYTPHSADFIGRLGERVAVYECVDDFTSSKGLIHPKVIGRLERRLIEAVDLLIVTAQALYDSKREGAARAVLVPNGVEADHFGRAADPSLPVAPALADAPHPLVGYLGTLNYWIDTELLARIAREHPDWTVALVGPHDLLANLAPFEGLDNVIMTGRVAYQDVPTYVKAFDVCLNPYVLDGVAEHCSPLKLYEYIATGKPIVSVDMPEAKIFEDCITIANNADEFVSLVEQAVQSDDGRAELRRSKAQEHTWQKRFEAVSAALAGVLNKKGNNLKAR